MGVPQETLVGARTRSIRLVAQMPASRGSSVAAITNNSGLSSTAPGAGRGLAVGEEPFFFASFDVLDGPPQGNQHETPLRPDSADLFRHDSCGRGGLEQPLLHLRLAPSGLLFSLRH